MLAGAFAGPLQATSAKQGPLDLNPALGSIEVGRSGLGPIPPPLPPQMPFPCGSFSIPHSLYFPSPLWIVAVHRITLQYSPSPDAEEGDADFRLQTQDAGDRTRTDFPSLTCTRRPRSFLWLPCIEFFPLFLPVLVLNYLLLLLLSLPPLTTTSSILSS